MSRLRNPFLVTTGLALLMGVTPVLAQGDIAFGGWPTQLQTRNIPAGTVVDPGSQLIYITDTGINLRKEFGGELAGLVPGGTQAQINAAKAQSIRQNPKYGVGQADSLFLADGALDSTKIFTNFVSITNTHPTQAVTVHFRYFNDECIDVLDFLVLLTCNDTLIFDPFNFIVPGTNFNTRSRFFGPATLLPVLPQGQFGSGRFVIFAVASGTSTDADDDAEFRFRKEDDGIIDEDHHCENLRTNEFFGTVPSLSGNNLHIFNASAVAFNFLIGHFTAAIPKGFIPGEDDRDQFLAYGVNAWTRPAVDLTEDDADGNTSRGWGDGDGPPLAGANNFRILTGTEAVQNSSQTGTIATNFLYLRSDVHGGDNRTVLAPDWGVNSRSFYGALGWTSIHGFRDIATHPEDPENQLVHLFSAVDDYNGSRHAGDAPVLGFRDRSYNLNGARTVYVLQIYDNNEVLFEPPPGEFVDISPPPPQPEPVTLKITVDCLRVWIAVVDTASAGAIAGAAAFSVDDLQVSDMFNLAPSVQTHLTKPLNPLSDASQGWVRFVRDNTNSGTRAHQLPVVQDNAVFASYVTIGLTVLKFEGFGAAWWLAASAADPLVSELGIVNP